MSSLNTLTSPLCACSADMLETCFGADGAAGYPSAEEWGKVRESCRLRSGRRLGWVGPLTVRRCAFCVLPAPCFLHRTGAPVVRLLPPVSAHIPTSAFMLRYYHRLCTGSRAGGSSLHPGLETQRQRQEPHSTWLLRPTQEAFVWLLSAPGGWQRGGAGHPRVQIRNHHTIAKSCASLACTPWPTFADRSQKHLHTVKHARKNSDWRRFVYMYNKIVEVTAALLKLPR